MFLMMCFMLSDFHVHPELFVSLDNYVYPSEDEEIVIASGSNSNTEGGDGSVQTAGGSEKLDASSGPKTKTIRVKRKADENTIKESCWYGVIHLIMHYFDSHWYILNCKIRQLLNSN